MSGVAGLQMDQSEHRVARRLLPDPDTPPKILV